MFPNVEAIGLFVLLLLAAIFLFVYLLANIKNGKHHGVFSAASVCGLVAFISLSVMHHRFSFVASLTLGFCMGFLAGAVWFTIVNFLINKIVVKKNNWIPCSSELWWLGVLPSNVYLGYTVGTLYSSYWWLKLVLVLFLGVVLVLLSNVIKMKSGKGTASATSPISLKNSAVLWVPVIMAIIVGGVTLLLK